MTERTRYGFGNKAFSYQMLLYFIPRQKSNPPRFRVYLCGNDRDIFIFVTDTENLCTLPDLVYTFRRPTAEVCNESLVLIITYFIHILILLTRDTF